MKSFELISESFLLETYIKILAKIEKLMVGIYNKRVAHKSSEVKVKASPNIFTVLRGSQQWFRTHPLSEVEEMTYKSAD